MPGINRRRTNPTPANLVGARVREIRIERGLSQQACAEAVQTELRRMYPDRGYTIDQSDISRMENVHRTVWDFELRALAVALNVSADYLLGLVDSR